MVCSLLLGLGCMVGSGRANSTPRTFPPPPKAWLSQAHCIEHYESGTTDARSNPAQRGYLQFAWGTWRSAGGLGDPADATRREQEYRAYLVYARDGNSWREWSTRGYCGLT